MNDPLVYFDRICCVSLRSEPQRLAAFRKQVAACNWPFREIDVPPAIDGTLCPPPPWWRCLPPAWGCFRSHLQIIENALNDNVQRLMVCEDDAEFVEGFREKVLAFIDKLPSNAEMVYYGGQTSHKIQHPRLVNDLVIAPSP
jgi:hypothetical protein